VIEIGAMKLGELKPFVVAGPFPNIYWVKCPNEFTFCKSRRYSIQPYVAIIIGVYVLHVVCAAFLLIDGNQLSCGINIVQMAGCTSTWNLFFVFAIIVAGVFCCSVFLIH
jgi:hypothetical protein